MPDSTIEWVRLLADIGSSVAAALALILAVCVAVIRWKDVFDPTCANANSKNSQPYDNNCTTSGSSFATYRALAT